MCNRIPITKIYNRLINLDNTSGIKAFFSIPHIKDECTTITIENVEINVDEYDCLKKIQEKNPENIITKKLNDSDFNFESDVASVLLRKATLVIKNQKASFLKVSRGELFFFDSHEGSFEMGDKYIWLSGESLDFYNKEIAIKIIFSGGLYLQFDDKDIIMQMIDFKDLISKERVKKINEEQYELRELKGKK